MKITSMEAIPVSYPEPNDFNALRHICLTRLETDDGEVGWGESVTMWPEASFATKALIEGMADLVVGRDPHADGHALSRTLPVAGPRGRGSLLGLTSRFRRGRS